jgi:UDP-N-acetylmuramoyl-tripeptide--D-alanyl-D-alanine ligase
LGEKIDEVWQKIDLFGSKWERPKQLQKWKAMRIEDLYEIFLKHPKVVIDSRKIEPGCMFFALKGPNFDANAFALDAIKAGAAWAIVDSSALSQEPKCIFVADVLKTLQELARHHRRQWKIPVLGITGSNGKTTTKELVAAVLHTTYPVHYTQGNLNNHIGVPLTILACPSDTEIAVIEMGANKPGDIAELCAIAEPTHGLITNIGKAHLEGFGGLAGVKRTKSELYHWLAKHQGLAFVSRDEKYLGSLSKQVQRRIFYGCKSDEYPTDLELVNQEPFLAVASPTVSIQTQIAGAFNFQNILTAWAVGSYFKVRPLQAKQALETYTPKMNRSQQQTWRGAHLFLDAYNANPSSMAAALTHFAGQKSDKKAIIIGDMFELGSESAKEHKKIYKQATQCGANLLITVGTQFGGVPKRKQDLHFDETEAMRTWFIAQDWTGWQILLKGSRGMHLESVLT